MKYFDILIAFAIVAFTVGLSHLLEKPTNIYSEALSAYSKDWRIVTDYGLQACDFSLENSIITEIEITKHDGKFEIKCFKGPRYDYTDYYYFKFSNCSETDARFIDSVVRKRNNCFFPLGTPVPENVNHYVAIIAQCLPEDKVPSGISCLPGNPRASVFYAVYDPETGKIFY